MWLSHSPHFMLVPIVLQYDDCVESMQDKQAGQGTRTQGQGARKQRAWDVLAQRIITSCVIASRHKTRPWAMCSSAFFSRDVCQFTTSALGRNTRLCRKVTTVICALPSLYPSLGTWLPSISAIKSISLPAAM